MHIPKKMYIATTLNPPETIIPVGQEQEHDNTIDKTSMKPEAVKRSNKSQQKAVKPDGTHADVETEEKQTQTEDWKDTVDIGNYC